MDIYLYVVPDYLEHSFCKFHFLAVTRQKCGWKAITSSSQCATEDMDPCAIVHAPSEPSCFCGVNGCEAMVTVCTVILSVLPVLLCAGAPSAVLG